MGEFVNSTQVRFNQSYVSCGVVEVHHLPDESPSRTAFALANHLYHKANGRPAAFAIWSDVVDRVSSRGAALADTITKLKVGSVFATQREVNPKTGNVIQVWLFHIDHDAFRKFYTEEFVNRLAQD